MLDGVSLDQLRAFIAAADEGSFSAAARKLRRAQSVVSELVSNLEGQIGVTLFDRSGRYPVLTPEGAVLLAELTVRQSFRVPMTQLKQADSRHRRILKRSGL